MTNNEKNSVNLRQNMHAAQLLWPRLSQGSQGKPVDDTKALTESLSPFLASPTPNSDEWRSFFCLWPLVWNSWFAWSPPIGGSKFFFRKDDSLFFCAAKPELLRVENCLRLYSVLKNKSYCVNKIKLVLMAGFICVFFLLFLMKDAKSSKKFS